MSASILAEVRASSQASIDNVLRRSDSFGSAQEASFATTTASRRDFSPKCTPVKPQTAATPEETVLSTADTTKRVRRNDPYAFQCIGDLNAAATLSFQAAFGQGFASFGYGYPFGYPTVLRQNESFDDINTSLGGESVGYAAPSSADVTPTKRRTPPAALSLSPVPSFEFACQPPPPHGGSRKHHRHGAKRASTFPVTDLSIALPSPLSAHTSACPSPLMDSSSSVPVTPTSTTNVSTVGKLSRGYCYGRPIPIRMQ